MRFWYVFVGCIFLFNPSVGLVDILPDLFGVILIMIGISKISALNTHVGIAYSKFKSAMWVSLGKLACLVISGTFDKTMMLTLSLAAAVIECVFLISAFSEMLDGMGYICVGKVDYDSQKTLGTLFFVLRSAGSFVPGVAAMFFDTSNGGVKPGQLTSGQIEGMLNILFVLAVTVFGVIWLCGIYKLIRTLSRDRELCEGLLQRYKTEILDNASIMRARYIGRATMMLSAALIPFVTFKLEGMLVMPELLFGVLAIIAMALCGDYGKDKKTRALLIVFTVISAASYALMIIYSVKFGDVFSAWEDEGFFALFIPMAICGVLSYVLLAICSRRIRCVLFKMASDSVLSFGEGNEYRRGALVKRVDTAMRFIFAYSVFGMVFSVMMPFLEWLWIIKFLFGAVTVFVAVSAMAEIYDEAKNAL